MPPRAEVLGCLIDRLDMEDTVRRCEEIIDSGGFAQHVAINAAKLVTLRRDSRLRQIIESCELVSADGQPIVWVSKLLGDPLPARVTGIDLMDGLLDLAERKAYRVYVLGARREVLEVAVRRLRERRPRLQLVGYHDGYWADADMPAVCAAVRAARPHLLFVAMSSPRKEYWIAENARQLGVPLVMGVGGAIDIIAGRTQRAPPWMQRAGLEWFFRLVQEPRRMWRRYLVTNVVFAAMIARALVARGYRPRKPGMAA